MLAKANAEGTSAHCVNRLYPQILFTSINRAFDLSETAVRDCGILKLDMARVHVGSSEPPEMNKSNKFICKTTSIDIINFIVG